MNDKKQFVNILEKTTLSQIEQHECLWEAKERKEEDKENKTCLMLQL